MNFERWWIEFEKILSKFSNENFIFRGQADKQWLLKTSFQREKEDNENYELIPAVKDFEIFLAKEGKYPFEENKDIYEWLRYGQHYGLATPYLDFSKSPYVSLFFASNEELKKDGKLFVLDIDKFLYEFIEYFLNLERIKNIFEKIKIFYIKHDFEEKTINSIKEKLKNGKSIIESFIEYVDKLKIEKCKTIENEKDEMLINIEKSRLEELKLLKQELQKELIKNEIVENEIFFYPFLDSYNNRMKRQQGCFIYYNIEKSKSLKDFINAAKIQELDLKKTPKFEKDKVLYEIIIPAKYKKDILNKLHKMDISNVTLFGDEEYAVKDAKLGLEHNLKVRDSKISLQVKM